MAKWQQERRRKKKQLEIVLRWSAHNRVFSPQQKSNASPAIFLSLQPQATVVECVLSEHFCGKVFLLYRIFINFYCLLGEIVHELAPCFISRKQAKWRKRKKKWENRVFPPLCEGRKIPFWHCSQIHFRFFFSLPFLGLKWRRDEYEALGLKPTIFELSQPTSLISQQHNAKKKHTSGMCWVCKKRERKIIREKCATYAHWGPRENFLHSWIPFYI